MGRRISQAANLPESPPTRPFVVELTRANGGIPPIAQLVRPFATQADPADCVNVDGTTAFHVHGPRTVPANTDFFLTFEQGLRVSGPVRPQITFSRIRKPNPADFNLNVLGLLLATKEAVKHMGPEGGSVINIGSGVSSLRPPNSVVYTATKGAVDAMIWPALNARQIQFSEGDVARRPHARPSRECAGAATSHFLERLLTRPTSRQNSGPLLGPTVHSPCTWVPTIATPSVRGMVHD